MRLKVTALAIILVLLISCKMVVKEEETDEGESAVAEKLATPESQFEDIEGNPLSLAEYKGKRIILNFWATWCRPCLEEMPSMQRSQAILEKENYIFLLASDQPLPVIKAFQIRRGFDLKFIKYNGSWSEQEITTLPTTYIYNEAGEKVEKIVGGVVWDSPEVIQKLKDTH
ncbi:TlpA family protein disulfide reductase [Eudoraea sp.]|uniref:TlpA family protein disulfide reductase n=1 Tax=Eudoraea sp. TaxID=1979955 RepID=UPI003C78276B